MCLLGNSADGTAGASTHHESIQPSPTCTLKTNVKGKIEKEKGEIKISNKKKINPPCIKRLNQRNRRKRNEYRNSNSVKCSQHTGGSSPVCRQISGPVPS